MKAGSAIVVAAAMGGFNSFAWTLHYGWWGAVWAIVVAVPIGAGGVTMLCDWPRMYHDIKKARR